MRRALAGIGAVALVGLVPQSCGSFIGLGPCRDPDVCYWKDKTVLETAHTTAGVKVESWIVLSVNRRPQSLHVTVDLQKWVTDSTEPHWATVVAAIYGLHNLPVADGKEHRVQPPLEYACSAGRWRVVLHYTVRSSTGQYSHAGPYFFPGPLNSSPGKRLTCRPPS